MLDRRMAANIDWISLVLIVILGAIGVVNLYSAASSFQTAGSAVYLKQLYWMLLGFGVMLLVAIIGYQRLCSLSLVFYAVVVILLVAVLIWGKVIGGSQRWLLIGPLRLQPSELARLAVVLVLAQYFQRRDFGQPYTLRRLIVPAMIAMVPAVLILKQPDLGTSLMILAVAGSVILINGIRLSSLAIASGTLLAVLPLAWSFLKDYQKRRIFSFLDPESDPLGAAYHLIQSKIAVGSGGFWGKGFMAGTQTQLHFLPEQHTDFAFSVLNEEWGFIGGVVVLGLLAALVYRGIVQATRTKDRAGLLCVIGGTAMIFWPTFINVGMVLGLAPVVGIPLPFVSYGGSNMLTVMAALGLIQSVSMRRYVFH